MQTHCHTVQVWTWRISRRWASKQYSEKYIKFCAAAGHHHMRSAILHIMYKSVNLDGLDDNENIGQVKGHNTPLVKPELSVPDASVKKIRKWSDFFISHWGLVIRCYTHKHICNCVVCFVLFGLQIDFSCLFTSRDFHCLAFVLLFSELLKMRLQISCVSVWCGDLHFVLHSTVPLSAQCC